MKKIPLINLAYVHDADRDDYVVFKVTDKGDFTLHTCKTSTDAENWINSRFKFIASSDGESFYTFDIDQTKPF